MSFPTHIVAVAGLVEDGNGNVLLVKTNNRGWDYPGGQVEVGEHLEEALIREIWEESGINVSVRCLAAVYSNIKQYVWQDGETIVPTKVMFDFLCDYVSGQTCTSEETSEVLWVPRDQAMGMVQHPGCRHRLSVLLNHDDKITYQAYETKPDFKIHHSSCFSE